MPDFSVTACIVLTPYTVLDGKVNDGYFSFHQAIEQTFIWLQKSYATFFLTYLLPQCPPKQTNLMKLPQARNLYFLRCVKFTNLFPLPKEP